MVQLSESLSLSEVSKYPFESIYLEVCLAGSTLSWLSVAEDLWELMLEALPAVSMGQSLIFCYICGA